MHPLELGAALANGQTVETLIPVSAPDGSTQHVPVPVAQTMMLASINGELHNSNAALARIATVLERIATVLEGKD